MHSKGPIYSLVKIKPEIVTAYVSESNMINSLLAGCLWNAYQVGSFCIWRGENRNLD